MNKHILILLILIIIFVILILSSKYKLSTEPYTDFNKYPSSGATSKIYLSNDKKYIKKRITKYLDYDVFEREVYILKLLNSKSYRWVPKLFYYNTNKKEIIMSYCGEQINKYNIPDNYLEQINKILSDLRKNNIEHNDIKLSEILVKNNNIYLCDFGWCSINKDFSLGINLNKRKKPNILHVDNNIIHKLNNIYKNKTNSFIPIFIIVHNRLKVLKESINSYKKFIKSPFKIIYYDSKSTYKPTIDYLKNQEKLGYKVYWSNINNHKLVMNAIKDYLSKNINCNYYVLTDPDIKFDKINGDILEYYIFVLNNYKKNKKPNDKERNCVGPMLRIDDIPDYYPKKQAVLKQHAYHWDKNVHDNVIYKNNKYKIEYSKIDTTFQLCSRDFLSNTFPRDGIRCLAPYSAKHLDWYINPNNMTEDQEYYSNNVNTISHWGRKVRDPRRETFTNYVNNNSELHIIIDWKQQYKKEYIVNKINNYKLSLYNFIEHGELPNKVKTMSKFYNMTLDDFRGETKFNIYLLTDYNPIYDFRKTSKGKRLVNTKLFDLKKNLRNNDYSIHGTDNIQETKDNLKVLNLFETYYKQKRFDSLSDVFDVLNNNSELKWVVMRNFEDMPNNIHIDEHLDVDLLVNDYYLIKRLLDASSATNDRFEDGKHRILNHVIINNKKVLFDFRCVGDNYYDINFQKNILDTRVKHKNFYIPNKLNHLYGLIYHAIIHKNKISNSYKKIFIKNNISCDKNNLKKLLDTFMINNNYSYVKPEPSVGFNYTYIGQ